jgi:hypothetical protein
MQHVRFNALAVILVLSTVMLTTIDGSQSSVFAQNVTSTLLPPSLPAQDGTSTPTTPASASDDESSSSNDDNNDNNDNNSDDSNDNNDESSGSSGSDDDDSDSQQDASSSSDDDDSDSQQDASSSDEEEDEIEDDFNQTNPLLEQIRNGVIGALSASGIPVS